MFLITPGLLWIKIISFIFRVKVIEGNPDDYKEM